MNLHADDDQHALDIVRSIVDTLPHQDVEPERESVEPLHDPATIGDVVPADGRTPYDVHDVIDRLVDGSRFHEFKPLYGESLVCGFAHVQGHPVAIVANNGILFSESAMKGAHFVELCNSRSWISRAPPSGTGQSTALQCSPPASVAIRTSPNRADSSML